MATAEGAPMWPMTNLATEYMIIDDVPPTAKDAPIKTYWIKLSSFMIPSLYYVTEQSFWGFQFRVCEDDKKAPLVSPAESDDDLDQEKRIDVDHADDCASGPDHWLFILPHLDIKLGDQRKGHQRQCCCYVESTRIILESCNIKHFNHHHSQGTKKEEKMPRYAEM